ncbi:MAG: hypothetical protein ACO3JF_00040 [Ilumatobacteraceae bacterium]
MTPAMNAVKAADAIAVAMTACRLPKADWTHDAHVQAALSLVLRMGAARALATLREAIPRYNLSTNTPNTETGGYHDTLTVYYVWAIDELLREGVSPEHIVGDALVSRTAPLEFWTRDELFSVDARRHWVAPTLTTRTRNPQLPV